MLNKSLSATLFLLLGFANALATPQIPDILIYEGKEYPIYNDILRHYFVKFPERNPKKEDEVCSALWRGYRSTFEVSDGTVYLKDVFTNVCFGTPVSELKRVSPEGKRLAADWYSGLIPAFYGDNKIDAYSLEFLDAFDKYSLFEVDHGKLREVRHFDNQGYRKFKKLQFQAYKATEDYREHLKQSSGQLPFDKEAFDNDAEFWITFRTKTFLVD